MSNKKVQLNFVPWTLPVPETDVETLRKCKAFSPLQIKPTRLNKHWRSLGKGLRYVIPNFRVTVLFEEGFDAFALSKNESKKFNSVVSQQTKKINDVITKTLMENFVLTSKDQLECSWLSDDKIVKINDGLKVETVIVYSNIIIDSEHEIDFWIACVEMLLRYK